VPRGAPFRRYIVKRIALDDGEQLSFESGSFRYWIFVTNDHERSPVELESEHRHKADVESGMRELKSNFGLHAFRKHRFMVWAWLLLVCLGHNLCCWTQRLGGLGAGRDGADLHAKRLRYRYLAIPTMVTRSGRISRCTSRSTIPIWTGSSPPCGASRPYALHHSDRSRRVSPGSPWPCTPR
jgi:hypothetical protein